jgi:hypothetical protein
VKVLLPPAHGFLPDEKGVSGRLFFVGQNGHSVPQEGFFKIPGDAPFAARV